MQWLYIKSHYVKDQLPRGITALHLGTAPFSLKCTLINTDGHSGGVFFEFELFPFLCAYKCLSFDNSFLCMDSELTKKSLWIDEVNR